MNTQVYFLGQSWDILPHHILNCFALALKLLKNKMCSLNKYDSGACFDNCDHLADVLWLFLLQKQSLVLLFKFADYHTHTYTLMCTDAADSWVKLHLELIPSTLPSHLAALEIKLFSSGNPPSPRSPWSQRSRQAKDMKAPHNNPKAPPISMPCFLCKCQREALTRGLLKSTETPSMQPRIITLTC